MSRVGKKPIPIPKGVEVTVSGKKVSAKGSKGALELSVHEAIAVERQEEMLVVSCDSTFRRDKALFGLDRMLLANMIAGVSSGYMKKLEIQGVGYKAKLEGKQLVLNLGFSHPINFPIPEDVSIEVDKSGTKLSVQGIDKQRVGQISADIRRYYPPEPYKGKGIRYEGEYVRKKEGKKVG